MTFLARQPWSAPQKPQGARQGAESREGSGNEGIRQGRHQASLPAEHGWGAGGNPSVNGAHLVRSSTAKAFLQDTFQHSVAEL